MSEDEVPQDFLALDVSLRCAICQELYTIAVTISERKCGHSFCSQCIRRTFRTGLTSMRRQASCPTCRCVVPNSEQALIPNRSLQEAVAQYKKLLPTLSLRKTATPTRQNDKDKLNIRGRSESLSDSSTCSNSRSRRRSPRSKVSATRPGSQDDEYIDDDESDKTKSPKQKTPIKKRPSTNYSGLKKKRLQELCAKEGLPTTGTEELLKSRHQLFITLWNAEIDSIDPKSPQELVAQVRQQEKAQNEEKRKALMNGTNLHSKYMAAIKKSREELGKQENNSASGNTRTKVSSGDRAFDKQINDNFKKLVSQMRQRQNHRSNKNHVDHSTKTSQPEATTTQNVTENEKEAPVSESSENGTKTRRSQRAAKRPANPFYVSPSKSAKSTSSQSSNQKSSSGEEDTTNNSMNKKRVHQDVSGKRKESKRSRSHRSISGPWQCQRCTLINKVRTWTNAECEICGFPRSSISADA